MDKYGKLQDDILIYAPNVFYEEGRQIITPNYAFLINHGYKLIKYTTPEHKEGFITKEKWEETSTEIIQTWEYIEIPDVPETESEKDEALALLGVSL